MNAQSTPPILGLPSELLSHVLTFLSLSDLLTASLVNKSFLNHSRQDTLYEALVKAQLPNSVPKPGHTWRELLKLHHPYWFIPKAKIWFSDSPHTGKVIIARYDHRINAIEAYALVAERRPPMLKTWEWNPQAIVHTFSPRIRLDLNAPVLHLDTRGYENTIQKDTRRLQMEMVSNADGDLTRTGSGLHSQLILTKPWPVHLTKASTPIWPPLTIPSCSRVLNESPSEFRGASHRPLKLSELSTTTFRLRRWMEFMSRPHGLNMRVGEDVTTWATLPEECYTPTPRKPWQGIWCGDYAGHGCEFLAVMQPDDPKPLPEKAEAVLRTRDRAGSVSSGDSWHSALSSTVEDANNTVEDMDTMLGDSVATIKPRSFEEDDQEPSGRIEAVKLTGDPNIPRGEYTFIAPEVGPNGLIRVATEDLFKGARIVRSVGHIAARGFRDDDYMTSQLILISHNRLAQYWETFGHVSFYERVNIDEFTKV